MAEKADVIARIEPRESPSWPGSPPRPDTLMQIEQSQTKSPLRTGRAIRSHGDHPRVCGGAASAPWPTWHALPRADQRGGRGAFGISDAHGRRLWRKGGTPRAVARRRRPPWRDRRRAFLQLSAMRQELKALNDAAANIVYGQKRIAWTSAIVRTAGRPTCRRTAPRQMSDVRIGQALARRIVPIMPRSNSPACFGLEYARRQS